MASSSSSPSSSSSVPVFSSIADYVQRLGGRCAVNRILIANNGIAAVKAIRSIRRWAFETFGNEHEVLFTVMATPEDLRANAEYIRLADSFVEVPGGANNNNYANVRLIVETAEAVGADAVWAGWGHASENPALPNSLLAAASRPIIFIGPAAGPMHALGDKIGSTIIAQSAGVPCIAWNGHHLKINYARDGLTPEVYAQADVRTVEEAIKAADEVGYPLMIKASEGGGGKGIRKVTDPAQLASSYRQVQGEVPGSPIFLMKLAPRSRHLEVQVFADEYGNAIPLFGRDCSVQRRHQKIVEEGPVLAAPPSTWRDMERAAVRLAKEVGYSNAGTVEYLFLEDDSTYAFLELNPRLQVEHPVTEMITGVNLPAAQLQVSMGLNLNAIPDIRRLYGRSPYAASVVAGGSMTLASTTTSTPSQASSDTVSSSDVGVGEPLIDFDNDERVRPEGHVIASRITAENPDAGFQPTSGAITELNFRSTPDVWGYFSVDSSSRVHEFADSQFGHLFAWGRTREEARQHMVIALKEISIRGDIRTTVEYLIHMMQSKDFVNNNINTAWLDARIADKITAEKPAPLLVAMMGVVWRAHTASEQRRREYIGYLERGQYPPPSLLSVEDDVELIYDSVKYTLRAAMSGTNTVTLMCNGTWVQAGFRALADGGLLVSLNRRSHILYASEESSGLRLTLDGATCTFTKEYDPTSLRAPMSGKLARYLVEDGAKVAAGAPYAEVEVMKMYMSLNAPEAGAIFHVKPEGSVLIPGDLIARSTLDDPSKVRRSEPFKGTLPQEAAPVDAATVAVAAASDVGAGNGAAVVVATPSPATTTATNVVDRFSRRWHIVARNALRILSGVLQGYEIPRDVYDSAWFDCDAAFSAPDLALLEVEEIMAVLASRLPSKLNAAIQAALQAHKEAETTYMTSSSLTPSSGASSSSSSSTSTAAGGAGSLTISTTTSTPFTSSILSTVAGVRGLELDTCAIVRIIDEHIATLSGKDASTVSTTAQPIKDVCERFRGGVAGAGRSSLLDLLKMYLDVERVYVYGKRPEDVIADLRAAAGESTDALGKIYDVARAHCYIKKRNIVVLSVLSRITEQFEISKNNMTTPSETSSSATATTQQQQQAGPWDLRSFMPVLQQLAELRSIEYSEVTLEARQMLVVQQLPSQRQRRAAVESLLRAMGSSSSGGSVSNSSTTPVAAREEAIAALVDDDQPMLDVLMSYFSHSESLLRCNAADVYVRRLYRAYQVTSLTVSDTSASGGTLLAKFTFSSNASAENLSDSQFTTTRTHSAEDVEATLTNSGNSPRSSSAVVAPTTLLRRTGLAGLPTAESYVDLSNMDASARGAVSSAAAAATASSTAATILTRNGVMAAFANMQAVRTNFGYVLGHLTAKAEQKAGTVASIDNADRLVPYSTEEAAQLAAGAVNVLHLSLLNSPTSEPEFLAGRPRPRLGSVTAGGVASIADSRAEDEMMETCVVDALQATLSVYQHAMLDASVRRVTFNVPHPRDTAGVSSGSAATAAAVAGTSIPTVSHTPLHDAAAEFVSSVNASAFFDGTASTGGGNNNANSTTAVPPSPVAVLAPSPAAVSSSAAAAAAAAAAKSLRRGRSSAMLGSSGSGGGPVVGRAVSTGNKLASPSAVTARQAGSLGSLLGGFPWVYTFRAVLGYMEDTTVRNIEPPASANLELRRLANFKVHLVPTPNRVIHIYAAEPLEEGGNTKAAAPAGAAGSGARALVRFRYFVRAIVRQTARVPSLDGYSNEKYPGAERMFVECLDALNLAMADALADTTLPVGNNHVFLNVLPVANIPLEQIEKEIKLLARRHSDRMRLLRISQVEFKINVRSSVGAPVIPIRLISSNPTGHVPRVDLYVETRDDSTSAGGGGLYGHTSQPQQIFTSIVPSMVASTSGSSSNNNNSAQSSSAAGSRVVALAAAASGSFSSSASSSALLGGVDVIAMASSLSGTSLCGELDMKPVSTPYPVTTPFERQRALAAAISDTVYAYDFIELLTHALDIEWAKYQNARGGSESAPVRKPTVVLRAVELVMRPRGVVQAEARAAAAAAAAVASASRQTFMRRAVSSFSDQYSNEMSTGTVWSLGNQVPPISEHGPAPTSSPAYQASRNNANNNYGGSSTSGGPMSPGIADPRRHASVAANAVTYGDTVLCSDGEYDLVEAIRPAGMNDIGMVAWKITMYTPQYGEESGGREIVLIANDITFRAGSFGTAEDRHFNLASIFARGRGLPRLYFAANSGARIGLAEEMKKMFRVAWNDPSDPTKGHKYLYLSAQDYNTLCATGVSETSESGDGVGGGAAPSAATTTTTTKRVPPVIARREVEGGEERYVIAHIIGRETDLGVENLRGSGTIAGETSRAYSESFTLSYVTGRTVGIGAYLVRLGQRCVQKVTSAPIILTGFEALNKLMGSEVYSSNQQIGGPRIMYTNGVSHDIVSNDLEGMLSVLQWLSYVPRVKGGPLPITDVVRGDEVDREIEFQPPTTVFDPRLLLTGTMVPTADSPQSSAAASSSSSSSSDSFTSSTPSPTTTSNSKWVSGFFDRDSWNEALAGWAKSVVVGRARLGGIPVGVIIPELRSTTSVMPADPASPASKENVVAQAGQVWYPDSSFKTAQAIRDFTGEDLPIIIFANWRGFSGGQRDMFDEVLKFGSYIVDALVACKQPVFVYIPPRGELRGGAWVVVDPTINPDVMEMYSDTTGRGGVLEPAGITAIKFRSAEQMQAARRIDPVLKNLDVQLKAASVPGSATAGDIPSLRAAMKAREGALAGVYLQVAHTFAELHDTPGRMKAKGTINGVVPWTQARSFFYRRLRRRLNEQVLVSRILAAAPHLSNRDAASLLRSWFITSVGSNGYAAAAAVAVSSASTSTSEGALSSSGAGASVTESSTESLLASVSMIGEEDASKQLWTDDTKVLKWIQERQDIIAVNIASCRKTTVSENVLSLGLEDPTAAVAGVLALVDRLPADQREAVILTLRRGIIFGNPSPASSSMLVGSPSGGGANGANRTLSSPASAGRASRVGGAYSAISPDAGHPHGNFF